MKLFGGIKSEGLISNLVGFLLNRFYHGHFIYLTPLIPLSPYERERDKG